MKYIVLNKSLYTFTDQNWVEFCKCKTDDNFFKLGKYICVLENADLKNCYDFGIKVIISIMRSKEHIRIKEKDLESIFNNYINLNMKGVNNDLIEHGICFLGPFKDVSHGEPYYIFLMIRDLKRRCNEYILPKELCTVINNLAENKIKNEN